MDRVEKILHHLKLSKYTRLFVENGIDDSNYIYLTHEDLKDMGIILVGHRMKIFNACNGIPLTPVGNVQYRINQLRLDLEPLFKIAADLDTVLKEK